MSRFACADRFIDAVNYFAGTCALALLVFPTIATASETLTPGPTDEATFCDSASFLMLGDDVSDVRATCTARRDEAILEAAYLQNASRAGGTALAAYPLVEFRFGLTDRLELDLSAPTQIAESGLHGAGLYPRTRSGFGVRVAALSQPRLSVTTAFKADPALSNFSAQANQPRYSLDGLAAYRAGTRLMTTGYVALVTSRSVGLSRAYPSAAAGTEYTFGRTEHTMFSAHLGTAYVARRADPQTFGDVAANQRLGSRTMLSAGLGTTVNAVGNSKAHYLAGGLNYRF